MGGLVGVEGSRAGENWKIRFKRFMFEGEDKCSKSGQRGGTEKKCGKEGSLEDKQVFEEWTTDRARERCGTYGRIEDKQVVEEWTKKDRARERCVERWKGLHKKARSLFQNLSSQKCFGWTEARPTHHRSTFCVFRCVAVFFIRVGEHPTTQPHHLLFFHLFPFTPQKNNKP